MFRPADLFDLKQTAHADLFEDAEFAWEILKKIESYLRAHLKPGLHNTCEGEAYIGEQVFLGEGTVVEDGVMIKGPAIIGAGCQIRHNAYIRENVIIGDNCVVGNSSEIKNSVLFNGACIPHFNYVGDSILGHKAHLGAGVKLSNFKVTPGNIIVESDGKKWDTGLRKFGALQLGAESRQRHRAALGDLSQYQLARLPACRPHRQKPRATGNHRPKIRSELNSPSQRR